MERNFDNSEFEQFIKRNADQYRLIPSEKVWKGISSNLHTRRKWYGLGLALLLVGIGVSVTWVMTRYTSVNSGSRPLASKQTAPVSSPGPASSVSTTVGKVPDYLGSSGTKSASQAVTQPEIEKNNSTPTLLITEEFAAAVGRQVEKPAPQSFRPAVIDEIAPAQNEAPAPVADNSQRPAHGFSPSLLVSNHNTNPAERYPLTIESVTNAYQAKGAAIRRKLSWQLYFTPTVSYRKLRDNKSFKSSTLFLNNQGYGYPFASVSNVNHAVTHKPDLGLELGLLARYPVSAKVNLTAGLQFNINRYDIRAYIYKSEPATISLNGDGNNNSMTAWTSYRNYNGYRSDWLKNFYFSVSAPVGAQVTLFGNNKTSYGVAGTVQPTYILRDRAYLISTDYKNYAEIPDLIRHFNVNTSLEAFVSYKTFRTRWQIGPQVRYQAMSSFQNKYPIRENLFDFGLKVGVTLNQ